MAETNGAIHSILGKDGGLDVGDVLKIGPH